MDLVNRLFRKKERTFEVGLLILFFLFSIGLYWKTFRINQGMIEIASKVWSDFAATIPLIRSFSFGSNFPPEYPIFAGPPIRYHFIFFALVGLLERFGTPLDVALNTLSAISLFSLLTIIYLIGKKVFKSRAVGLISVVLFLLNGSLSFLEFFKTNPLSRQTLNQIITNTTFPSFGPYDGKIVSAFWSLNIYTNQRHLALAYASFLLLVLLLFTFSDNPKRFGLTKILLIGLLVGLFPFIHLAVFGMMAITLITGLIIFPKIRIQILLAGLFAIVLALPQIIYMGQSSNNVQLINPGYLVENLTAINFLKYWALNLGLLTILAPIGFLLSIKNQRRFFIIFIILFIIGNLFQFSSEIAANHKFFNLFVIGANFYVAYFLVWLWQKHLIAKLIVIPLLSTLTFSGIIEIFPIINDDFIKLADVSDNKAASFIYSNTEKNSVFLNTTYLYDPASLAGRKIYLGWPYFAWSAGYDTNAKADKMRGLLKPKSKTGVCVNLINQNIDYIEIKNPSLLEDIEVNYSFFEDNFNKIFYDKSENISIYDVKTSCRLT